MLKRDLSPEEAYQRQQERGKIAHKRALRWRIMLPLGLVGGALVLIPLLLMLSLEGAKQTSISAFMLLCLLIPMIAIMTLFLGVLVALTYGMARLYGSTSHLTRRAYRLTHRANTGATALSKRVAAPLIHLQARAAYLEEFVNRLGNRKRERTDR